MQLLNSLGEAQFTPNGLLISDHPQMTWLVDYGGWQGQLDVPVCQQGTPQFYCGFAINTTNPFNPTTAISFDLSVASRVRFEVFDISGSRVGVGLAPTRKFEPGTHEITFNGSNLASGIYFYRIKAGDFSATGKMVLMK